MTRRTAVLVALGAAAALAASGAGPWVHAGAWSPLDERAAVVVDGLTAAPALAAAALVALAAGVLLALAGRRTAVLAGLVVAGAGALAAGATLVVVADPRAPAAAAARATLGIDAVGSVRLGPWPWVALAAAVLTVVAGVRVAATARRWAVASARHDRAGAEPAGVAPTGPAARSGGESDDRFAGTASEGGVGAPAGPRAADAAVATWDALTRGEDPT